VISWIVWLRILSTRSTKLHELSESNTNQCRSKTIWSASNRPVTFCAKRKPKHTMKTKLPSAFRRLAMCGACAILLWPLSATASAQSAKPKPLPTPRRPLAKPPGARNFDQFARRDASARLIAAAGTRVVVDPGDFYSKGEANYKAGKYEAAAKDLREAVRLSPDWEDPHYVLALALTELGQLQEAIEEFKQVVRLAIKDQPKILSFYNMGNAYADLGEYQKAIASYNQAIKLNENSSNPQPLSKPHNNLGLAYAALGQLTEAISEFNLAVQLKPDYAEAHYNLGVAYLQLGKKDEARAEQQRLMRLKPELATKLDALIKK
jgi:Flp pilus assembly protein TadD